MSSTEIAMLGMILPVYSDSIQWPWHSGDAYEVIVCRQGEVLNELAAYTTFYRKRGRLMSQVIVKEEVEGNEVGPTAHVNPTEIHITSPSTCANPIIGQEQVITYIADDMTDEERRVFVAHVSKCAYCLKEVVLWRMAQVSAEKED